MAHTQPEHLLGDEEGAGVLMRVQSRVFRAGMMRRATRGFTLIELAVTFTLLGILIAAGLPSFMAWIRNSQVRTVAEALRDGMHRAQTEAVRLNQTTVMSLTNATPAVNAPAAVSGKNWSVQTIAQFGGNRPAAFLAGGGLSDIVSNVTVTSAVAALCFNSDGRLVQVPSPTGIPAATGVPGATCAAGAQDFDIAQVGADRPLRVHVGLGGQVRMCDPNRPAQSATSPEGC